MPATLFTQMKVEEQLKQWEERMKPRLVRAVGKDNYERARCGLECDTNAIRKLHRGLEKRSASVLSIEEALDMKKQLDKDKMQRFCEQELEVFPDLIDELHNETDSLLRMHSAKHKK